MSCGQGWRGWMRCDEEERDEVCYYCQGVISLEIFPKSWQEQEH